MRCRVSEKQCVERLLGRGGGRAVVILVALCAAMSCGFSEGKKEAEALAERYFLRVQNGDIEGALLLYSPRFYQVTSRVDWRKFLEAQRDRCGTPKTHKLVSWNVFSSIGTNAGVRTILVYDVQYTRCQMSEKITTFKPDDGETQIQGHFLRKEAGSQDDKAESQVTLKT